MSDMQRVGPVFGTTGSEAPFTAGITGAQRVQDAHGRYMEAVRSGNVYKVSVAGGAATAYTGAAGGTPLIGVHNPPNSGVILAVLAASINGRAQASAAGTVGVNLWAGPSATPTGTVTAPTNLWSLSPAGSAALGFSNTALTGSTALGLMMSLLTYYWATAAAAAFAPGFFDIGGLIVLAPGNQVTLGATAALTSATYDASLIYEEILTTV
jgi:hypothetical protein